MTELNRQDFASNQEVRWCPGCGDHAILTSLQKTLPEIGIEPHNLAFISGIGCAGRLPYYMNAFGFHTIHGRALSVATGLKMMRPELSVWVVTGDGDALSIGGNHLLHAIRRNVDINILLINNGSGSNSEIFAEGFRKLGLGKIVGTRTAGGVIGTASYTLIDGTRVRRPSWGCFTTDMENLELVPRYPDITVEMFLDDEIAGRDPQLVRAVQELLSDLDG